MSDYFEIDFLDVESNKSGDAIPLRYTLNGLSYIHVVDGGFQDTGQAVVDHINKHYGNPTFIDHVVVTHPDGDHAGGLRKVLEDFQVGALWMLRPWLYAEELIDRFERYSSVENLASRLKELYPNIEALEELAEIYGVPIYEPFQGTMIGAFTVMAPTKTRYLDLVVESERTPKPAKEEKEASTAWSGLLGALEKAAILIRAAWGDESFSTDDTSAENEMSVVQYANLCGKRILLTGDAGRNALWEAAAYAPYVGLQLPGIDRFQVPHHGSRRNVSTDLLDYWLGERLDKKPDETTFSALISSAKADEHHPRKAVIRACIHRGAAVASTEGKAIRTSFNAPERGWSPVTPLPYPDDQEA